MENFGTAPAWVYGTVHGPGYCGDSGIGGEHAAGARLADGFHAYAVHWEPDRIRWFFDGTLYHTVTPAWPWRQSVGLRPRLLPAAERRRRRHRLGSAGQIDVVSADHAGGLRPRLRSIGVLAD